MRTVKIVKAFNKKETVWRFHSTWDIENPPERKNVDGPYARLGPPTEIRIGLLWTWKAQLI